MTTETTERCPTCSRAIGETGDKCEECGPAGVREAATPERPKAGELVRAATDDDAWDVAMSGDAGAAVRVGLIADRERIANTLHYRLVKMSAELDNGARQLEAGRRQHVISRSNWFSELPILIEQLDDAAKAVESAERLVELAGRASVKTAAYRPAGAGRARARHGDGGCRTGGAQREPARGAASRRGCQDRRRGRRDGTSRPRGARRDGSRRASPARRTAARCDGAQDALEG